MKVGIITLHKVLNFGSALQAYALQHFIESERQCDVELIDYKFPNDYHKVKSGLNVKKVKVLLGNLKDYIFKKKFRTKKRFKVFYKLFFHLSPVEYKSITEIVDNPPQYDLYITGSDQVWNYKTLRNDPVMYCSFAPKKSKIISFGASFTNKALPEQYHEEIKKRLGRYSKIGVREQFSLVILSNLGLTNYKQVAVTCDPTLLLSRDDYRSLSKFSDISLEGDYILVYGLNYAYNPEPALSLFVDKVASKLKCKVITLWLRHTHFKASCKEITGIGPCEFCYLFDHAKFIVTSSFHGTMFSVINRKPFMSIIPESKSEDSRIKDFLDEVGLEKNYITADNTEYRKISIDSPYSQVVENKISSLINKSKQFLLSSL